MRKPIRRLRPTLVAGLAAGTLLLSACGNADSTDTGTQDDTSTSDDEMMDDDDSMSDDEMMDDDGSMSDDEMMDDDGSMSEGDGS